MPTPYELDLQDASALLHDAIAALKRAPDARLAARAAALKAAIEEALLRSYVKRGSAW